MDTLLPPDFEAEILPFIDETQPTSKETVIERIKEHQWQKGNAKTVLNYLYAIRASLFFIATDGRIRFA